MAKQAACLKILTKICPRGLERAPPFEGEARQHSVEATLHYRKTGDLARRTEIKELSTWIVAPAEQPREENEHFLNPLPDRVRKGWAQCYGKKNLFLSAKLMKIAGMAGWEIEAFCDYLAKGQPLVGKGPGFRLFRGSTETEAPKLAKKQNRNERNCEPPKATPAGGPPKWARKSAKFEPWEAFQPKVCGKGMAGQCSDEEAGGLASKGEAIIIKAHPARQGEQAFGEEIEDWDYQKARPCFDYRDGSTYRPPGRKLGFGCRALITQMLEAQMTGAVIRNGTKKKKCPPLRSAQMEKQAWEKRPGPQHDSTTDQPDEPPTKSTAATWEPPGMAKTDERAWYPQLPTRAGMVRIISIYSAGLQNGSHTE